MSHQALSDLYPTYEGGEIRVKEMSLSDQFDIVIRTTGPENRDWENRKIRDEFIRMNLEEPRIPTWVLSEIARYPNNWSMDI